MSSVALSDISGLVNELTMVLCTNPLSDAGRRGSEARPGNSVADRGKAALASLCSNDRGLFQAHRKPTRFERRDMPDTMAVHGKW